MDEMNKNGEQEQSFGNEGFIPEDTPNLQDEASAAAELSGDADIVSETDEDLQKRFDKLNDMHLRLMAEFDNYRKRTIREKADLIKSAGEHILTGLLPVIDDFERALENMQAVGESDAIVEGVELIYSKFMSFLAQQGVKPIEAIGQPFDTETSEAVAIVPSPEKELKGKVIDCVQTGYMLNDKVIRHAKVVVGE
ncbi:nucleotide exchange factor GrpE [Parabacteroides sp. OttesenSCG-928-G07]|nr:nucleotide exchange factor GrpE [Parabacteroides sp. OttesenSCG-928-G21]MDL2277494.1 nucleotide exchange factor GrpE [Parabacteroides sp. OttesenSCG-928-G07]